MSVIPVYCPMVFRFTGVSLCVCVGGFICEYVCTYVSPCAYVLRTEVKVYVGHFPELFYALFLFHMYGYFACTYAYHVCIPGAHRGQKKTVDP